MRATTRVGEVTYFPWCIALFVFYYMAAVLIVGFIGLLVNFVRYGWVSFDNVLMGFAIGMVPISCGEFGRPPALVLLDSPKWISMTLKQIGLIARWPNPRRRISDRGGRVVDLKSAYGSLPV
jgi:hypothetical protein